MRVKNVFRRGARTCQVDTTLAEVVSIMWECDCGVVPVVDAGGRPCGMITDRDICMALGTRDHNASSVKVGDVISGRMYACSMEDRLEDALEIMRREQVKRLPVLDGEGKLTGILSLNYAILSMDVSLLQGRIDALSAEVLKTIQAISSHREAAVSAS